MSTVIAKQIAEHRQQLVQVRASLRVLMQQEEGLQNALQALERLQAAEAQDTKAQDHKE